VFRNAGEAALPLASEPSLSLNDTTEARTTRKARKRSTGNDVTMLEKRARVIVEGDASR
jgi:hypothetical protein